MGVKGRILKKLKSIPQVPYLKQPPFLHSNEYALSDPSSPLQSGRILCDRRQERIESPEPVRDFKEYYVDLGENKENFKPVQTELNGLSFRRPDPNSATLFDPNLLAAFKQAVIEYIRDLNEAQVPAAAAAEEERGSTNGVGSLIEFEEKNPPGGRESIILYTTSLRGIRKTFEDCSSVKLLLENLKLVFVERDLSMHMEFRDELWRVLGFRAIPPRLFVKGRYIGGADDVLGLHERGRLLPLVEGMPRDASGGRSCEGCSGLRFAICEGCNGGRKVFDDGRGMYVQCLKCNENGLIVCRLCC